MRGGAFLVLGASLAALASTLSAQTDQLRAEASWRWSPPTGERVAGALLRGDTVIAVTRGATDVTLWSVRGANAAREVARIREPRVQVNGLALSGDTAILLLGEGADAAIHRVLLPSGRVFAARVSPVPEGATASLLLSRLGAPLRVEQRRAAGVSRLDAIVERHTARGPEHVAIASTAAIELRFAVSVGNRAVPYSVRPPWAPLPALLPRPDGALHLVDLVRGEFSRLEPDGSWSDVIALQVLAHESGRPWTEDWAGTFASRLYPDSVARLARNWSPAPSDPVATAALADVNGGFVLARPVAVRDSVVADFLDAGGRSIGRVRLAPGAHLRDVSHRAMLTTDAPWQGPVSPSLIVWALVRAGS